MGRPDYQRPRAPLDGRPLRVTPADGTELYAEVFGPDDGETVALAHGWTEQIAPLERPRELCDALTRLIRETATATVAYR